MYGEERCQVVVGFNGDNPRANIIVNRHRGVALKVPIGHVSSPERFP